ncbi:MAG: endolytic transglycosylase MltG, partial [Dehalococcoidia bacterium]
GTTAVVAWQIVETPGAVIDEIGPGATVTPIPGETAVIPIERGDSPETIGERLEEAGVINSSLHFRILISLLGYDQLLQAGLYEFDPGTPTLTAVQRIRSGQISPLQAVVPEGLRREEVAAILAGQGVIPAQEFLAAATTTTPYDFDFLAGLPMGTPLEGYLFPATYSFGRDTDADGVVEAFLTAFDQNLSLALRQEAAEAGLSLHTVVTIASIVEREARVSEERPVIAQVFLKRLRLGQPLEADPTVQYAVANDPANVERFGHWKQGLTQADLSVDSPYNTYLNSGLPPGPIANPGLDAIEAVIRPADTNYLFFVAKPDGSHAFAETLEEHLENIDRYGR